MPAIASLAGLDLERAQRSMRVLERAGLVSRVTHDRYRMHALVRVFAAELAASETRRPRAWPPS
ncbi:MAG TPA: hypothetical protein VJT31_38660 [Rugosimonospora sp.]|nr:hypothetical protein [Rugosimonospora sp.]